MKRRHRQTRLTAALTVTFFSNILYAKKGAAMPIIIAIVSLSILDISRLVRLPTCPGGGSRACS